MDQLLTRLSDSVATAHTLEALARPLLEMLHDITGLESTYLTSIDLDAGLQSVDYARNVGELRIPEGLKVPWGDTLCKRAIDEGRAYTRDASECWGDSQAAQALGIRTYVSAPVRSSTGALMGTLCAASRDALPLADGAQSALGLFSRLIGHHLEREMLVNRLKDTNQRLALSALTDPLTGLPNRRALAEELDRLLARADRAQGTVIVGLVDLDGFKAVNDRHGHAIGDALLQQVARRLAQAMRATDMIGRLGGDEFLVIGPGPGDPAQAEAGAAALKERASSATTGRFELPGDLVIDYAGASVGVVAADPRFGADHALKRADEAMYSAKRQRRPA